MTYPRKSYPKNVQRDAALVEAAMAGRPLELLAMRLGMSPDELFVWHPRRLKRQSNKYREQVVEAVIALQDKVLSEVTL